VHDPNYGLVFDPDALVIRECQHIRHFKSKLKRARIFTFSGMLRRVD
jgi:hypothetical protein